MNSRRSSDRRVGFSGNTDLMIGYYISPADLMIGYYAGFLTSLGVVPNCSWKHLVK